MREESLNTQLIIIHDATQLFPCSRVTQCSSWNWFQSTAYQKHTAAARYRDTISVEVSQYNSVSSVYVSV